MIYKLQYYFHIENKSFADIVCSDFDEVSYKIKLNNKGGTFFNVSKNHHPEQVGEQMANATPAPDRAWRCTKVYANWHKAHARCSQLNCVHLKVGDNKERHGSSPYTSLWELRVAAGSRPPLNCVESKDATADFPNDLTLYVTLWGFSTVARGVFSPTTLLNSLKF